MKKTKETLEAVADAIASCSACPLRETATAPVPGLGQTGAKYFIVGEAPGREEDAAGVPFVGLAGKRLNELLALAGINPNDCYITNVVRCRPPMEGSGGKKNRKPKKSEIKQCKHFLFRELALVRPEYIITLGDTALSQFCEQGISKVHGTMMEVEVVN